MIFFKTKSRENDRLTSLSIVAFFTTTLFCATTGRAEDEMALRDPIPAPVTIDPSVFDTGLSETQPREATPVPKDTVEKDDAEAEDSNDATVSLEAYEKLLKRVDELETSFDDHQKELDDAAAAAKKKSSWKMSGRVHIDQWNFLDTDAGVNFLETGDPTDDPEDRWDFSRILLEYAGEVPNNMLFRTQIDFNNPSRAEMKDVYLGF